jgi:hypothetical protein
MATGAEVLEMLIPTGGWVITGDDFNGIQFLEANPITKKEFEAGFPKVDQYKDDQAQIAKDKKDDLMARLGISAEELALLLS